jgi:hypothetical protein
MLRNCKRVIRMRAKLANSLGTGTGMGVSERSQKRITDTARSVGTTVHFGVFALLLAVTVPVLLESFSSSADPLDASWAWFMGYAFQHHLQWGKAVLFTYGPLGFLANPYFYSDHLLWCISATARLASWLGFGFAFGYILCRLAAKDKPSPRVTITAALAWVLGASFIDLATQAAFIGILLLVLAIAEERLATAIVALILSGALLAFGSLIKSTALIISLFALLTYPALWCYAGRDRKCAHFSLIPLLSFVVIFCALWLISSQSLGHLPAYLRGTWAIAHGYTPAMAIRGDHIQTLIGLVILLLFSAIVLALIFTNRRRLAAQSLLLGVMGFWAWKEGFTRHDLGYLGHAMAFYGTALLIAAVGIASMTVAQFGPANVLLYCAYLAALVPALHGYPLSSLDPIGNYGRFFALMASRPNRAREQRRQTAAIQAQFTLPSTALQAIATASVNVIPWSLMIAEGYHLRVVASPVFQSYSAYTPYLDHLNARQIWKDASAATIIYTYTSIDGRYPAFDEPETFRAILRCFKTLDSAGAFLVLGRTTCARPHLNAVDAAQDAAFGRWIAIPRAAGYATIAVRTTMIGHAANLLYKPVSVHLSFRLADGTTKGPYRFIYPVAVDGLFVKYFIGTQTDAARLFSGSTSDLHRVTAIKLTTDRHTAEYWHRFRIQFFGGTGPNQYPLNAPPRHPSRSTTSARWGALPVKKQSVRRRA